MSATPVDYSALAKQAGATDSQPAPAQSGAVDYAALAKQAGATDSQPAPAVPTQKPGLLDTISDKLEGVSNQPLTSHLAATEAGAANLGQGVIQGIKGAAQVVHGAIGAISPPTDGTEKHVALLGPPALAMYRLGKAVLSQGKDAAGQIAQVPGAIRDINQSPDPVGIYGQVAAKTAGHAGGQALVAAGTAAVPKAIAAVKNLRDIPAAISTDTVGTLNKVAASEGLPTTSATTAREAAGDLSKSFIQRAKSQYKVVDDAVGGDLKPVQEKITSLQKAIRINQNVNPDLADKFTAQLAEQQDTLKGLIEKAKANGVPNADKIMQAGDKDYSRGMAMQKVQKGVATASGQAKMGGHPHPGGYASQIDRLERTGVLQKALGQDGTDALVQDARSGLARTRTVNTLKGAAVAGVAYKYGGSILKALSGK